LKKLKEEGIDVPVIVITAHLVDLQREELKSLGAKDTLSKPTSSATLMQAVEKYKRTGTEKDSALCLDDRTTQSTQVS
jgi:FixJ family two-component response regulator